MKPIEMVIVLLLVVGFFTTLALIVLVLHRLASWVGGRVRGSNKKRQSLAPMEDITKQSQGRGSGNRPLLRLNLVPAQARLRRAEMVFSRDWAVLLIGMILLIGGLSAYDPTKGVAHNWPVFCGLGVMLVGFFFFGTHIKRLESIGQVKTAAAKNGQLLARKFLKWYRSRKRDRTSTAAGRQPRVREVLRQFGFEEGLWDGYMTTYSQNSWGTLYVREGGSWMHCISVPPGVNLEFTGTGVDDLRKHLVSFAQRFQVVSGAPLDKAAM